MAAGKSSVARKLSSAYGFKIVETDILVQEQAGCTIPEIFSRFGETAFRKYERDAVQALGGASGIVVSTGGGIIENEENVTLLNALGISFHLQAPFGALWKRIASDSLSVRPLALSREIAQERFEKRKPLYAKIANRIMTENSSVDEVTQVVFSLYLGQGGLAPGIRTW